MTATMTWPWLPSSCTTSRSRMSSSGRADGSSLKEYLRDYATQKLGVAASDTKRINAVRNYAGSQLSYMRLYQALTQGTRQADALMATVFSIPA